MKIMPRFKAEEIYHKAFGIDWPEFQLHALNTGKTLHKYIQGFINASRKRSGGTGNLAKAVNFDVLSTTGMVHWGIGHIPTLNQRAKYWYVTNYGKKVGGQPFIPGGGKYRPTMFQDGPADSSKRGIGTTRATKFRRIRGDEPRPSVVRPMHYIEFGMKMLQAHVSALLVRYKKL
jgi:hypothetical protein